MDNTTTHAPPRASWRRLREGSRGWGGEGGVAPPNAFVTQISPIPNNVSALTPQTTSAPNTHTHTHTHTLTRAQTDTAPHPLPHPPSPPPFTHSLAIRTHDTRHASRRNTKPIHRPRQPLRATTHTPPMFSLVNQKHTPLHMPRRRPPAPPPPFHPRSSHPSRTTATTTTTRKPSHGEVVGRAPQRAK